MLALTLGRPRSSGTGRSEELLKRVKALAPDRVEVFRLGEGSTGEWAKARTGGEGADFVISALGARAPRRPCSTPCTGVRRGGRVVNVGGVADRFRST